MYDSVRTYFSLCDSKNESHELVKNVWFCSHVLFSLWFKKWITWVSKKCMILSCKHVGMCIHLILAEFQRIFADYPMKSSIISDLFFWCNSSIVGFSCKLAVIIGWFFKALYNWRLVNPASFISSMNRLRSSERISWISELNSWSSSWCSPFPNPPSLFFRQTPLNLHLHL